MFSTKKKKSYQNILRKKINIALEQKQSKYFKNNIIKKGMPSCDVCLNSEVYHGDPYDICEFIKCVIYIFSYALYLTDSNKGTNNYTFYSKRKNKIRDHYKALPNKSLFKIIIHCYVQEIFSINFLNKKGTFLNREGTKETKLNYDIKDIIKILKTYKIFIVILGKLKKIEIENNFNTLKLIGQGAEAKIYELTKKNLVLRIQVVEQNKQNIQLKNLMNARDNLRHVNEKCPEAAYKLFYGEGIYDIYEKGITDISIILKNLKKWNNSYTTTDTDKNKKLIKLYINLLIKCIEKIKCIHEQNILHLDIKPENIMIFEGTNEDKDIDLNDYNEFERTIKTSNIGDEIVLPKYLKVKYIDFNLSEKVDNILTETTVSNKFFGTPVFLSQKNIKSENKSFKVNYKTDLYALARMFQELILTLNKRTLNSFINNRSHINHPIIKNKRNNLLTDEYISSFMTNIGSPSNSNTNTKIKTQIKTQIKSMTPNENNIISLFNNNNTKIYKDMTTNLQSISDLITP
jgi:serine/threonine protein kinase